MKLRTLSVFTLTLCSLYAIAEGTNVNVLTWNIKQGIGSNNPNSDEQPFIASVVNYLKPDVWNINELGGATSGYYAPSERSALITFVQQNITIFGANPVEGRDFYVYASDIGDGYTGDGIVSCYPLSEALTYSDGLRGMVHANVQLPNGSTLGDFTTHLKATTRSSSSTTDSEKRQSEAEASAANLKTWFSNEPKNAAVLTGDFNLSEDFGESSNWAYGNVGDMLPNGHIYHPISTLKAAGFSDGVPVSNNGNKDTISSTSPQTRFDYNLYSNQGGISYLGGLVYDSKTYAESLLPPGIHPSTSGYASDHLPVFAEYRVEGVPEPTTMLALGVGVLAFVRKRRG